MRRSLASLLLAACLAASPERAIRETGLVADLPSNDRLFTEAFLP